MSDTISRRQAREQAFILAFEKLFIDDSLEEIVSTVNEAQTVDEMLNIDDFAISLVSGMLENCEAIDELIESSSKGWRKNRISRVALTVMRLSVYQMNFCKEKTEANDPVGVIISEAVRITKKYSTTEDSSFVNGVLGAIAKSRQEA